MGCGCRQKNIDYASTDEYLQKIRKIAKNMAMDEGVWYVVVKRSPPDPPKGLMSLN